MPVRVSMCANCMLVVVTFFACHIVRMQETAFWMLEEAVISTVDSTVDITW